MLDTKVLLHNYGRWKIHLFVQVQCFLMTSALVFGLVSAVATSRFMDPALLVGLIFMSCVATTISSNVVMTRQAHGTYLESGSLLLVSDICAGIAASCTGRHADSELRRLLTLPPS